MAGRAIGQAFHFPASSAAVTMIVPEKEPFPGSRTEPDDAGHHYHCRSPAGAFLFAILPVQVCWRWI